MLHVNMRRKVLVAFLCLVSFTVGCFLTSMLSIGRLRGVQKVNPLVEDYWDHLRIRDHHIGESKGNVSVASTLKEDHGDKMTTEDDENIDEDLDYVAQMKERHKLAIPLPPTSRPVSKFHYLVDVRDPRANVILHKVIRKLPSHLMQSVVVKNGLADDKRSKAVSRSLGVQQKWKLLIGSMQELGYEQRLPVVINIGVKKSGTNAFGFFIAQHPQIIHSIGNEVHYFDWNYGKGIEYYRSRMMFSKADKFTFEKTPRYFVTHDAPKHMKEDLLPNVKFILCVRDPIDRAKSEFRHEEELSMRRNGHTKGSFQKLTKAETSTSQGKKFEGTVLDSNGNVNLSNEIVQTSAYSKHFKRWLEFFPRDRFYVLSDEKVNKDILAEMKNIEKFLGLEPFYKKSMFYYDDIRHGPCMHGVPKPCPAKSTPGIIPKAEPGPEVNQKLRDFYRPYNQEFEKLSQMEFSWTNL